MAENIMENKKEIVTKSNKLNEARYKLTPIEQKLILSVVAKIDPKDEDFKTYQIKTIDFIGLLGSKRKSIYADLKRVVKGLLTKTLEIYVQERNSTLFCNWFSSAEYFHNQGYMEFSFDPKLKPYLIKLKECFISYQLKNIVQLKSFYSIRFYELLKQFEKIGMRILELEELRTILGIEASEYTEYYNFKARVLEPARKEVSEKTDISFNYTEIKENKRITHLKFEINKQQTQVEGVKYADHPEKETIDKIITKHKNNPALARLDEYIEYAERVKPNNFGAYLNSAIKENWNVKTTIEKESKQDYQEIEELKTKFLEMNRELVIQKIKDNKDYYQHFLLEQEDLTNDEKDILFKDFKEQILSMAIVYQGLIKRIVL